jgi:hypothetical protein
MIIAITTTITKIIKMDHINNKRITNKRIISNMMLFSHFKIRIIK